MDAPAATSQPAGGCSPTHETSPFPIALHPRSTRRAPRWPHGHKNPAQRGGGRRGQPAGHRPPMAAAPELGLRSAVTGDTPIRAPGAQPLCPRPPLQLRARGRSPSPRCRPPLGIDQRRSPRRDCPRGTLSTEAGDALLSRAVDGARGAQDGPRHRDLAAGPAAPRLRTPRPPG